MLSYHTVSLLCVGAVWCVRESCVNFFGGPHWLFRLYDLLPCSQTQIIADIRTVLREINVESDKLSRTTSIADETVYQVRSCCNPSSVRGDSPHSSWTMRSFASTRTRAKSP